MTENNDNNDKRNKNVPIRKDGTSRFVEFAAMSIVAIILLTILAVGTSFSYFVIKWAFGL